MSDSRLTLSLMAQRCGLDVHPDVFAVVCSMIMIIKMAGLPVIVSWLDNTEYEVVSQNEVRVWLH